MNQPSKLTRVQVKLLARSDLAPARACFEECATHSRNWDKLVSESRAKYGERPQGGFVSGIYSEHLPEAVRLNLRNLASAVSLSSDRGYKLRPARVHLSTMRALKDAVKARDGSGYYG